MSKNKTFEEFVNKFKPKKTTDDCMTPDAIYDAVKTWVVKEYRLEGRSIIRPFWPGADYKARDYPKGCVVIDNPPFSILAKIKDFYLDHGIDFFLFAPHLTLFSRCDVTCKIVVGAKVEYENGAKVLTSFVTILDEALVCTAPELREAVMAANVDGRGNKSNNRYRYPDNVTSSALLSKVAGVDFRVRREEGMLISRLDSQKQSGKSIFGGGLLLSDAKAAELKAAELKADELKVETPATEWLLSEREREIIASLH